LIKDNQKRNQPVTSLQWRIWNIGKGKARLGDESPRWSPGAKPGKLKCFC